MNRNQRVDALARYIEHSDYQGYDPYDGLNSGLLKAAFGDRNRWVRLAWIQFFKRCPMNLRPFVLIPKTFNSKAGALFLLGYLKLFQMRGEGRFKEKSHDLFQRISERAIPTRSGIGWGYPFGWQARAFHVPRNTPNLVATVYVGNALLDFAKVFPDSDVEALTQPMIRFITQEMVLWEKENALCFSYVPQDATEVHNANLMAAALLSRVCRNEKSSRLETMIRKAVAFSVSDIQKDGYWPYGTKPHHRWMDNFHTAFNLEALLTIERNLGPLDIGSAIRKVFDYYMNNLFLEDGTPKYYHNKIYPVDIHTIAQAIIIFSKTLQSESEMFSLDDKNEVKQRLESLLNLAFSEFWDPGGHFYYQKNRFYKNKISYMRWGQAWMFYALACYLEVTSDSERLAAQQS